MTYPIYIIGAGSIVNDAHLPAYKLAGYKVEGIFDTSVEQARNTAERFDIPNAFEDMPSFLEALPSNAIIDVAVPGKALLGVLKKLPNDAAVLMQKPMGEDYETAKAIIALAKEKNLLAAVNFQLRYAPFILAVRRLLEDGKLGEIYDIEINVNVYTPWHTWEFLFSAPRVEILYHSIHYIDLVRSFIGNPESVYAKTIRHPAMKELASVRTAMILDYGSMKRATILTNHTHVYGPGQEQSYIKLEGTKGAAKVDIGLLKNYPTGTSDKVQYTTSREDGYTDWQELDMHGSWFPHAFIGSMEQVMVAKEKGTKPDNSVDDALFTMACVEAAYQSSEQGGVLLSGFAV